MKDEKLIALLDQKFNAIDARFDGLETEVRKLRVSGDEHNVKLEQTIELMQAVDEKIGRFREETAANFVDVEQTVNVASRALLERIAPLEKKAS